MTCLVIDSCSDRRIPKSTPCPFIRDYGIMILKNPINGDLNIVNTAYLVAYLCDEFYGKEVDL
jgi:hypothetical protein